MCHELKEGLESQAEPPGHSRGSGTSAFNGVRVRVGWVRDASERNRRSSGKVMLCSRTRVRGGICCLPGSLELNLAHLNVPICN